MYHDRNRVFRCFVKAASNEDPGKYNLIIEQVCETSDDFLPLEELQILATVIQDIDDEWIITGEPSTFAFNPRVSHYYLPIIVEQPAAGFRFHVKIKATDTIELLHIATADVKSPWYEGECPIP